MSVEDLKKYGQLCNEKEEVRNQAKTIGLEDIGGQIAYAKELGLSFTQEDLVALAKEAGLEKCDELNEEDLEKVAGGVVTTTALAAVVGIASCLACGAAAGGLVIGSVAAVGSKAW